MGSTRDYSLEALFSLKGKTVLLTGAAGGIGAELARGLAGAGAELALCDIALERAENLAASLPGSRAYRLDVAELSSIHACVEAVLRDFSKIDILVNCAGINKREGYLDVTEETYDRIMDINLKGMYFLSQDVAKHMRERKSGNIINIASHNSVGMLGGCSVYGASKSGVAALTRSMAVEWARYGIRANAIAPGHILTELTTVTWEHPTRSVYLRERIAMERPGTPDELVGITVMLASDSSSYLSGAMIHVDGGCLAGGKPWEFDTNY